MKPFLLFAFLCNLTLAAFSQPFIAGQFALGNRGNSVLTDMKVTKDRGLIIVGYADTAQGADKTEKGYGGRDYWVIKTDSAGHKIWDRTLGGTDEDLAYSVIPTQDGNYLVAGRSASFISGNKTETRIGDYDVWLVKLDNNGNILWDKTIGTTGVEGSAYADTTLDGNYIVATSAPYGISGNKTSKGVGSLDYWIFKVNPSGILIWDKAIGGSSFDNPSCIKHTADSGFIIGGISPSNISGYKTEDSRGTNDYWVVKINKAGNFQWDKTLGTANDYDEMTAVVQTADKGYLAYGYTNSGISGDKTEPGKGLDDIWMIKLSAAGVKQWDKTYGGSGNEYLGSLISTADSGVAFACSSSSNISGDKTEDSRGDIDCWLVKLNKAGNIQWDKTIGGNTADYCYALAEFNRNQYFVGGWTYSRPSGDRTKPARGVPDMWITAVVYKPAINLVKTGNDAHINKAISLITYPNPAKNILHVNGLDNKTNYTLHIVDSKGNIFISKQTIGNCDLNIEKLKPGIYYLNAANNDEIISGRFIKE